jgi:uncharacterized protein YijF (DUF1287 family)
MIARRAIMLAMIAAPAFAQTPDEFGVRLATAARAQVGVTRFYDPAYVRLTYPNGDVPADRGVCTDVVIRAYRALGFDLQELVHEDMRADFSAYPKAWGLKQPDRNIDHRRIPNLETFLRRRGARLAPSRNGFDYVPGDLVPWRLAGSGLPHIGIVDADRYRESGRPRIIHNIGWGVRVEDILFQHRIIDRFRWRPQIS